MAKRKKDQQLSGAERPLTPEEERADELQGRRIARMEAEGTPDLRPGETYEVWD